MSIVHNEKGFSLIELLSVVAIIGILAVIGIPQYQKFKIKAFQAEAKTQLVAILTAERSFFVEYNGYHHSLQVIGYAPAGRARYNSGFGSVGITPINAPIETTMLTSKSLCGGPFGVGPDNRCQMIVQTPALLNSGGVSVTATGFFVQSVAYEDFLVVQNEDWSQKSLIAKLILGQQAQAALPSGAYSVDGWFMDQSGQMSHQKWETDSCEISSNCGAGGPKLDE